MRLKTLPLHRIERKNSPRAYLHWGGYSLRRLFTTDSAVTTEPFLYVHFIRVLQNLQIKFVFSNVSTESLENELWWLSHSQWYQDANDLLLPRWTPLAIVIASCHLWNKIHRTDVKTRRSDAVWPTLYRISTFGSSRPFSLPQLTLLNQTVQHMADRFQALKLSVINRCSYSEQQAVVMRKKRIPCAVASRIHPSH